MLDLQPIEYVGGGPRRKKRKNQKSASFFGGWFLLMLVVGIGSFFVRPLLPFLQSQWSRPSEHNAKLAIEELKSSQDFSKQLAAAALERTKAKVEYDPGYYDLTYPGGDIPPHKGICSDLVVRSYRTLGVDLQQLVHEDMRENFRSYPQLWKLKGPDKNMDHRRVPNLQRYFTRNGKVLEVSHSVEDYEVGDVVAWRLPFGESDQGASHIGIVVPGPGERSGEKWVVHNIGSGPEWEDKLFSYEIVGHYRFSPREEAVTASAENEANTTLSTAPQ